MRVECLLAAVLIGSACEGDTIRLGAGRDGPQVPALRFETPQVIDEVSFEGATDDDPSLNGALTLLYFNSRRAGGLGKEDIWLARRAGPQLPWGAASPVAELNSEQRETGIALSDDGLQILFSSDRAGGQGGLDIYSARRAAIDQPFDPPERVAALCSEGDDLVSALARDGQTVYLARRASEAVDYALFVAQRSDDADFAAAQAVSLLDARGAQSDAFPLGSLQLLFTRDEQLVLAERSGPGAPFRGPTALADLNSPADDRDVWAAQDLGYVVFSSDRSGSYLLYEARRTANE